MRVKVFITTPQLSYTLPRDVVYTLHNPLSNSVMLYIGSLLFPKSRFSYVFTVRNENAVRVRDMTQHVMLKLSSSRLWYPTWFMPLDWSQPSMFIINGRRLHQISIKRVIKFHTKWLKQISDFQNLII